MSPIRDLLDIDYVGRYKLIEQVGVGGFAVVYRAVDPYIGRELAVKVSSLEDVADDRSSQQSFLRKLFIEAEAAGKLLHPNIVTIFDVGIQEPYYYIAMEFMNGRNLKYHCHPEQKLSTADAIDTVIKVCHGLDYAHQRGVVHRDIKSTNIMLGNKGEIKIADFGLAYMDAVEESKLPFAGTTSYMAPEQLRRETPTVQSDLYSLGVVLYEILAMQKPFFSKKEKDLEHMIQEEEHVPIQKINAEIPESLSRVIDRALEKKPHDRYPDALSFARDLEAVLKDGGKTLAPDLVEKIKMLKPLSFFADFSDEEMSNILQIGTWMKYSAGEMIVAQTEQDVSFFVIISGGCEAQKERKRLGQMGRGQCFGEISFLLGSERTATVSARTECQLLKLNPKKIDILPLETQVKLYRSFAKNLAQHLLAADQRAVD